MQQMTTLFIAGIPLMAVIFGLVEFSKKLGLTGPWLTVASMLLGVAFGLAYQIAIAGLPVNFLGWFTDVIFGLAMGLVTSGFYDFADSRLPKIGP